MRIGELAAASGFGVETLRYYERIGLIPPAPRDGAGRRDYGPDMLAWLAFLERLRITGMPIRERIAYAELRARGPETAAARREILARHRSVLADRIAELARNLDALDVKIATYDDAEEPPS